MTYHWSFNKSNRTVPLVQQELLILSELFLAVFVLFNH